MYDSRNTKLSETRLLASALQKHSDSSSIMQTLKLCYSKDDRAMRSI